MSLCKDINFNPANQNRLDRFLFGKNYNPSFVTISPKGLLCEIHIENQGQKSDTNPNYYRLQFSKRLGSGTYGTVLKFVDDKKKVEIAVKFTNENDEELISEKLSSSNCNILKVKYSRKQGWNPNGLYSRFSYFMELADGDLDEFLYKSISRSKKNPLVILDMVETIRKQLVCLYDLDNQYVYTDLKPPNILYKCNEKKKVQFMLGDLGSAVPTDSDMYISSYPPVGFKSGFIELKTKVQKEGTLGWQVGILLLFVSIIFSGVSTKEEANDSIRTNISKIVGYNNIINLNQTKLGKIKLKIDSFQDDLYSKCNLKKPNFLFSHYFSNDAAVRANVLRMPLKSTKVDEPNVPSISPSPPRSVPRPPIEQVPMGSPILSKLTVVQLREMSKQKGCKGYSKMKKKDDLIQFIKLCIKKSPKVSPPKASPPKASPTNKGKLTVVQLRELAKRKGCKGYSKLKKDELIQFVKNC